MRVQRHTQIVARVRDVGIVSVGELSAAMSVSPSTIRRDLVHLDRAGVLARVRGGAALPTQLLPDPDAERPFASVAQTDSRDKDAVAAAAAGRVVDGDVVALDIGTTTALLARHLRGRPVTVVTNSLAVLDELRDDDSVELILLGGLVRRPYHSLVGVLTEDALRQIRVDRAFLGTSGVDADGSVRDSTLVEVPVKRTLLDAAGEVVVVADRHKLPGSGALRVCGPKDYQVLITNEGADERIVARCREEGVEVVLA